jgi:hypothetical protein
MNIPEYIEVALLPEQKNLCLKVLSICSKYHENSPDHWVEGVLLFALESYLRVNKAIDECDGDTKAGFLLAHEMPPLLPNYVMHAASRAMRRLDFNDVNEIIPCAEETAVWYREWGGPNRGTPFRKKLFTIRGVQSLVDMLCENIPRPASEASDTAQIVNSPLRCSEGNDVCSRMLGTSRFSKTSSNGPEVNISSVVFVTLKTEDNFLTEDPVSHPESTIFSEGNKQGGVFSPYRYFRGCGQVQSFL